MPSARLHSRSPRRQQEDHQENWQDSEWQHESTEGSWGHGGQQDQEAGDPWFLDVHNLVLEPSTPEQHGFTLLLLHSCTGGPDDWIPFFHRLDLQFRHRIRALVPCSPRRFENHYGWPKELNSWFEYEGDLAKFPEQLHEQRERILHLMDEERRRLPDGDARRLVLGGLSQGAALAVDCALHAPYRVGGVLALRGMALPHEGARPSGQGKTEEL
eukprot:TRINITY_DN37086_c0_g1_i1.p1 TRINITY_DN37086_c0_g1~~TRINITY_DN37086_c0_g1_i1.p1  ORF type:complete len:214 (-),score=28.85 TRINITY_DN37086_c0_g1_i1:323-964(-)